MPPISVVIPTFNNARFIGEAIQSVLNQTYCPSEVIVIDDGSNDGTEKIVRRISSPIPVFYYWQKNQGPSVARNYGVSVAKSNWVAFQDADDFWAPEKLAVQVEYMDTHPAVKFVYCDIMGYIDEGGQPISVKKWDSELHSSVFRGRPFSHPSTVLVEKDLYLKAGGFPPSLRYSEDFALFSKIALNYRLHYIPQGLVKVRHHPSQLTADLEQMAENWGRFFRYMWQLWNGDPTKQAILVKQSIQLYIDLSRYFVSNGDFARLRHFQSSMWKIWWDFPEHRVLLDQENVQAMGDLAYNLLNMGDYDGGLRCIAMSCRQDSKKEDLLAQRTLDVYESFLRANLASGQYRIAKQSFSRLRELWQEDLQRKEMLKKRFGAICADFVRRFLAIPDFENARECCRLVFLAQPWSWKNLRRWVFSYVPGARDIHRIMISKRQVD